MTVEARLAKLGIALPEPPAPVASYVPWVRAGSLVFVSGQGAFMQGHTLRLGLVGADVTPEDATEDSRITGINLLAQLRAAAGSLDRVRRIVKLTAFVASAPGFRAQPQVANGASDLMLEVFGDAGRHARSAVGVAELPFGICVEIDLIAELEELG